MKPIENFRCLLQGRQPSWIPFSPHIGAIPGFSEPIQQKLRQLTGADDPAEHFGADVRLFSLPTRFGGDDPGALHASVEPGTTFDEWGVGHWAGGSQGTVDRMYPPLADARSPRDVDRLPSPVIDVDVDTSAVAGFHAAGYPVFGYSGSVYEWSWWLRGMERFLVDLVSNPPLAEAVIRKVADYTTRLAMASAQAKIDVLCVYDDAGMQRGMQLSPRLWRQYVKPAWKSVIQSVRDRFPHVRFFLHSCGKIDPIIPDVIEIGFDVLHPVQPECMSFDDVYRQYGKEIVLCATISAQRLFPFGTPHDVRDEVRRLAEVVSADRRSILMPSNVIQPETPWENVVAFFEEARAQKDAATRR